MTVMKNRDCFSYSVSLTLQAHREADKQAKQHINPKKSQQVYNNVLARSAVDFYLQILGISTNWEGSESNDRVWQSLFNISDLLVTDCGKIECIPIDSHATHVEIPPEIRQERIAYVFVELEPYLKQANIIGFLPQVGREAYLWHREIICLEGIESIELLPEYLQIYCQKKTTNIISLKRQFTASVEAKITCLSEWLQESFFGEVIDTWMPELESSLRHIKTETATLNMPQFTSELQSFLLGEMENCNDENRLLEYSQRLHKIAPKHPQAIANLVTIIESATEETLKWNASLILGEIDPQHRLKGICCFKIIKIDDRILRLRLAIRRDSFSNHLVLIGVYPVDSEHYLPSRLSLQIFDEFDNLTIADSNTDRGYLQVQIDGSKGELFSVKIITKNSEVRESFVI
jgi:hypothetical protein